MPWSGGTYTRTNGVYSGTTVWAQDAAAGTNITTGHHDTHDQDLATGLNNCATVDGTNQMTTDFKPKSDAAYNLGSSSQRWNQGYFADKVVLSAAINEASATVASASTLNIGAAVANYLIITGTTTITAFDTIQAGVRRILKFSGALTLTHDATKLILPGAADITTAAGDVAEFESEGSGNWRCTRYLTVSGQPVSGPSSATSGNIATFSGTTGRLIQDSGVASTGLMPTGAVLPYAGSTTAPTGWLNCDGSAVSRTTYATLFGILSTTYGSGDGSTTFNLPDLRGRAVFGYDASNTSGRLTDSETGGISAAALGNSGGQQAHTLTQAELPAVAPTISLSGLPTVQIGTTSTGGNLQYSSSGVASNPASLSVGLGTLAASSSNLGSGTAHNVVNPGIVLNYIIKT